MKPDTIVEFRKGECVECGKTPDYESEVCTECKKIFCDKCEIECCDCNRGTHVKCTKKCKACNGKLCLDKDCFGQYCH